MFLRLLALVIAGAVIPQAAFGVGLTGGRVAKFLNKDGTAKDRAIVKFVKDPAIAQPLPDPTAEASSVRFVSDHSDTGAIPLAPSSWKASGKGFTYKSSDPAGGIAKIVFKPTGTGGKLIIKAKGDAYGANPIVGPVSFVQVELAIGSTRFVGRFVSPPATLKSNTAAKVIFKGSSVAPANRAPSAHAGEDQTVPVGATALLDGSASSDPDGDTLSYQWTLVTAPSGSSASLSDASTVAPSFMADTAGTYVCELTVSDGTASSAPDRVTIRSQSELAPVANAGPDQTVEVGDVAQLDGTGSSDPNGDPLTFEWTMQSRPDGSAAVLSDATSATPSFLLDVPGQYVLDLVVSDGALFSAPDAVIVDTANVAPVANAGRDLTAAVGTAVVLDGSASTDADGDALTFAWSLVSAPGGSTAELSSTSAVMPTLTVDVPGTYVVELVVGDGAAFSEPDTVVITTGNSAPVANAGPDQAAVVGQIIQLDGSGSTDVNGDALTYSWSLVTAPAGSDAAIDDPTSVTPEIAIDVPGLYVVQLIVNDGHVDSAPDTVVISTFDLAPIAHAGAPQTVQLGDTVQLDGSGSSDPNDDPLSFHWALTVVPDGSSATLDDPTSAAPTFVVDEPGVYVAQLIVSDGTHISQPATVAISTAGSRPVAYAGSDQVVFSGAQVQLNGTQSFDPDGEPLTYEWTLLTRPAGSSATLSDPTSPQPAFVADLEGPYVVQLIVHDGTQPSLPDTVLVTTSNEFISLDIALPTLLTFATAEGTVELSKPAGVGGVRVFLASQVPEVANVPTSVTIPQGATSLSFTITSFETAGSATITAFTRGFVDGEATVTVVDRQTSLVLPAGLVGVGKTLEALVTLDDPAPAGGATLSLSSSAAAIASIVPSSVTIPAGETSAPVTVHGHVTGNATFTVEAEGYVTAEASVTVTNDFINLPVNVVLAPGQTLPYPISLSTAAPAGGATISLVSSEPGRVTVSPATVQIDEGQTTPAVQPEITGDALGEAVITATATSTTNYAPGIEDVTVKLGLTILPTSITVVEGRTTTVTLSLSAQAPSGGASVNLSLDDPSLATFTTPVTFPAGVAVQEVTITGAAVGSTMLRGSGTGIDEAVAALTVEPPPAIHLSPTALTVGKDLMASVSGSLEEPAPAGNLALTITSLDTSRVLLSPDGTTACTPSIVVQVPAGSTSIPSFRVCGLADAGSAAIEATATDYAPGTATVTLVPSGFVMGRPSGALLLSTLETTSLSSPTSFQVWTMPLNPATLNASNNVNSSQPVRPGAAPVSVTVTSSDPAVGVLTISPVVFAANESSKSTAFDPEGAGTAVVSIATPSGWSTPSNLQSLTATVTAPALTLANRTVGKDLQESWSLSLDAPAPAGGLEVTLTSGDENRLLLSSDPNAVGSKSITLTVPAGSSSTGSTFYAQALAGSGTVTVTATAPAYATTMATVTLVPSGFVMGRPSGTSLLSTLATTSLSSLTSLQVWAMPLNPATLNASNNLNSSQPVRPGAAPVSVAVTSSDPAVGVLTTSPVVFAANEEVKTTAFDPEGAGIAVVSIATPSGWSTPSNLQSLTATVTAPALTLANRTVGKDLQESWSLSLDAPAPAGNLEVTLTSGDENRLLLSSDPNAVGSKSITLTVPAGSSSTGSTFYAQALAGSGTVTVTATAPAYDTVPRR